MVPTFSDRQVPEFSSIFFFFSKFPGTSIFFLMWRLIKFVLYENDDEHWMYHLIYYLLNIYVYYTVQVEFCYNVAHISVV